jgi:multidrug efflux system membrane fusion protein
MPTSDAQPPTSPTQPEPPGDAPPRRRYVWWLVALLVIVGAGAGTWYWMNRSPGDATASAASGAPGKGGRGKGGDASRATPVVAAPVRKGPIDVYLSALGTVTPRNVVVVRPRVDGQLLRLAFTEGQMVKSGDLLAEIDPRPFEVQLAQAVGQMARDTALLKNAQIDLERYRTLLSQDSISKQQVDTQEALVAQYKGATQTDQGQIDNAKLQIAYSRVTAPITGRIGLRQVDPGNVVRSSDTNGLVVITQMQPMTVVYPIPEDNLPRVMKRLKSGENIPVLAFDRDQKVQLATGKLLTVDNQIDTTTGTVKLKAEFPNTDLALFPNQFVNVRMQIETLTDATLVPTAAIQRGAPGTFVYVVKDGGTVSVAPVKLGPSQAEVTVVESGVSPGDQVVIDGTDKLREGARVELITREPQSAGAGGASKRGGGGGGRGGGRGERAGGGGAGSATPGGTPPNPATPDGQRPGAPPPGEAPPKKAGG